MTRTRTKHTSTRPGRESIGTELKRQALAVNDLSLTVLGLCRGVDDTRVKAAAMSLRAASELLLTIGLDVQFGAIPIAEGPPPPAEQPTLFEGLTEGRYELPDGRRVTVTDSPPPAVQAAEEPPATDDEPEDQFFTESGAEHDRQEQEADGSPEEPSPQPPPAISARALKVHLKGGCFDRHTVLGTISGATEDEVRAAIRSQWPKVEMIDVEWLSGPLKSTKKEYLAPPTKPAAPPTAAEQELPREKEKRSHRRCTECGTIRRTKPACPTCGATTWDMITATEASRLREEESSPPEEPPAATSGESSPPAEPPHWREHPIDQLGLAERLVCEAREYQVETAGSLDEWLASADSDEIDDLNEIDAKAWRQAAEHSDLDIYSDGKKREPSPPGHITVGSRAIPIAGPLVDDAGPPKKRTRKPKPQPQPEPEVKPEHKLWHVHEVLPNGRKTYVDCVYSATEDQARIELSKLRKSLEGKTLVFTLDDDGSPTPAQVVEEKPDGQPTDAIRPGMYAQREGYFIAEVRGNAAFGVRAKTRDAATQYARDQVGPDAAAATIARPDDGTIARKKLAVFPIGVQTAEEALAAAEAAAELPPDEPAPAAETNGKPKLFNVYLGEPVERLQVGAFIGYTHQHSEEDALEYYRDRYPKYRKTKLKAVQVSQEPKTHG